MIRVLLLLLLGHVSEGMAGGAVVPGPPQLLPETVRITVPALVTFDVPNVTLSTDATSGVATVSFNLAVLNLGRGVRISVKADGDLTPPGGPAIPASNISWQTSNVSGGVGTNGVLSKTTYTQVFQGNVLTTSGRVDLTWRMSAPGTAVRAGTHQVLLRWRIESAVP